MTFDFEPTFINAIVQDAFSESSYTMYNTMEGNTSVMQLEGGLTPLPDFDMPVAQICLTIGRNWMIVPPIVSAPIHWLCPVFSSQDSDLKNWHRYSNKTLCWVSNDDWKDLCGCMNTQALAMRAAYQLTRNVRVLLQAHWVAYINHLEKWPNDSWLQRPHGIPAKERNKNG